MGSGDIKGYKMIRDELIVNPSIKSKLPIFLETCEDLNQFWTFIKMKFPTWAERREYIFKEFEPVLFLLKNGCIALSDETVTTGLARIDSEYIQETWKKVLERRNADPEGAITSARTLLEGVFKHILDEGGVTYEDKDDLPKLYRLTSKKIGLSPSQETDELIKKILGGCQMVAVGLGELRNKLGDAHGKGKTRVQPNPLYAELAVNLAGTMATFLIASWEEKKNECVDVICAE
ncbi:MAG: abortive infection family protein [Spirochaetes bacterium]|nr:abortive infection family protein [Spirochaetota bacterium]